MLFRKLVVDIPFIILDSRNDFAAAETLSAIISFLRYIRMDVFRSGGLTAAPYDILGIHADGFLVVLRVLLAFGAAGFSSG